MVEFPGVRTGTGWVYSARDGLLVTAFHVVNGTSEVRVKVGRRPWRRAAVVAASPCQDVALLAVMSDLRVALGPRTRDVNTPALDDLLQATPVVSPGQSGGPVANNAGQLIGMNFGTLGESDEARGVSIRLDRLVETIDTFRRGEAPGWLSVGSTFATWCRTVGALPAGWAKLTIVRLRGGKPETVTIPVNRSHVRE